MTKNKLVLRFMSTPLLLFLFNRNMIIPIILFWSYQVIPLTTIGILDKPTMLSVMVEILLGLKPENLLKESVILLMWKTELTTLCHTI